MTSKKRKQDRKNMSEDRYTNVLLEEMNESIKIMAEGQVGIRDDLANFKIDTKQNFEALSQDLANFKIDTKQNFEALSQDLANFKIDTKQNFDLVFQYLSRIEEELMDIKKELEGIKNGSIPIENLVKNTERIAMLERQVADLMSNKISVRE